MKLAAAFAGPVAERSLVAGTWVLRAGVGVLVAVLVLQQSDLAAGALATVAVVAVALGVWGRAEQAGGAPPWLVGVCTSAIGLVGGLGTASSHQQPALGFAIMATISAGAEASSAWLAATLAAAILGLEVGAVVHGSASVAGVLGLPALFAGTALAGRYRRSYRIQAQQARALLAESERARAEQERSSALAERARIAREIHDVLGHSLGALGIQLQTVEALLADRGDVEGALARLAGAQRLVTEGVEETRRAVHALRTDAPPLPESLRALVAPERPETPRGSSLAVSGEPFALAPTASLALLRVAQEALVNARKHAPGSPVRITLDYGEDAVELDVRNAAGEAPPASPPSARDGGYGLVGMRERLRLLDGSLTVDRAGEDWRLRARVPR